LFLRRRQSYENVTIRYPFCEASSDMRIVLLLLSNLCSVAGLGVAFWYVAKTGRVVRGILTGWALTVLCAFLDSVLLPEIAAQINQEYRGLFPEAIVVPAAAFLGWIPSLSVVGSACQVRWARKGEGKGG